ncbi:MAG TPA: hypothetical protein ENF54_03445 [Desulfobacteraceae bacterium]|nr:hypothetical protein [Desulfobacteraceae bacterium]
MKGIKNVKKDKGNIKMKRGFLLFFLVAFLFVSLSHSNVFAHGCNKCHKKEGVKVEVPAIPPINLMVDGKKRAVTLADAFKFHGHACPGLTIAFRALQYGINLLYGSEIPEQSDLLIFSRMARCGPKDMLDFLMKGNRPSKRTWPPVGMKGSRRDWVFVIMRKSTCEAVTIRLKPERFPKDFFKLKKRQKEKTITPKEWEKLHTYMKDIILTYPTMPAEELFGKPRKYRFLCWGTILPGEMDKRIRQLRKESKRIGR